MQLRLHVQKLTEKTADGSVGHMKRSKLLVSKICCKLQRKQEAVRQARVRYDDTRISSSFFPKRRLIRSRSSLFLLYSISKTAYNNQDIINFQKGQTVRSVLKVVGTVTCCKKEGLQNKVEENRPQQQCILILILVLLKRVRH